MAGSDAGRTAHSGSGRRSGRRGSEESSHHGETHANDGRWERKEIPFIPSPTRRVPCYQVTTTRHDSRWTNLPIDNPGSELDYEFCTMAFGRCPVNTWQGVVQAAWVQVACSRLLTGVGFPGTVSHSVRLMLRGPALRGRSARANGALLDGGWLSGFRGLISPWTTRVR